MEIQFGNLEQTEPQRNLRPDQDCHFAVATVGDPGDQELKIFVDLDVLRDMEAHARTNTRVELGGVMLGRQCLDDKGVPFVLVTDALRARHYEATKGSFKFTHDTWSQITQERKSFRPDLEMVGWYHTHPGWSVFLSGMDLFICNNFFNRPLDVALVIDPCADDRGWFQWLPQKPDGGPTTRPTTGRTGGFFLTTGRYRQQELEHFARAYNKEPHMNQDPRYSGNVVDNSFGISNGNQPMVNLMDNRKPVFEIVMLSMLLMQFLLFAVIGWKILTPGSPTTMAGNEQAALLQQKLNDLETTQLQQTRQQAYQEVLQSIVAAQTGDDNLVTNFAELKSTNQQLQHNVTAQMALAEKLNRERDLASQELLAQTGFAEDLSLQLVATREKVKSANTEIEKLKTEITNLSSSNGESTVAQTAGSISMPWWWLVLGGIAVAGIAGPVGYWLSRMERDAGSEKYDDRNDQDRMDRSFGELAKRKTETITTGKTLS